MGDMNQSPSVIHTALAKAAEKMNLSRQPYQHLPIVYPTHINTKLEASWIDNMFVYSPDEGVQISSTINPDDICSSLSYIVNMLINFVNKE